MIYVVLYILIGSILGIRECKKETSKVSSFVLTCLYWGVIVSFRALYALCMGVINILKIESD